ncbi:MAG: hypothetical protein AB7L17_09040 [Ilumatobacteraceae bacterium]
MFVTRHANLINPELRERIWRMYELAFRPITESAVSREMLYRTEFDELVADPSNRLWVLWNDNEPIGATMITTDISTTRYLSRSYFEEHYPEHVARNALHYVLFVVVHPAYVARGAMVRLARESFGLEAEEGALVIFDAPMVNQPGERGGIAELVSRLAKMVSPGSETKQIEVQRYYAIDFATGARHVQPELAPIAEHADR